jgi:hypothetical protein
MRQAVGHEAAKPNPALDDTSGEWSVLYSDERGVSRRYEVSLRDNEWQWWRTNEMSRNGGNWEADLQLTYTRITAE